MRRVQGKFIVSIVGIVVVTVIIVVSLFVDVFVMDLTLCISLMEAAVLVSPKKLLVAGQHWHIFSLQHSVLKTVIAMNDLLVRHLIMLLVSCLVVRVSVLVRSLIEVTDFWSTSDRQIVLNTSHRDFGMVSFLGVSVLVSNSVATSVAIAVLRNAIHVSSEHPVVVSRLRASMCFSAVDRHLMMHSWVMVLLS